MSGPVIGEDSTISVVSGADVAFQNKPADNRFENVEYIPYKPIYSIGGSKTIEFNIAAQSCNKVLLFAEHILELELRIVLEDGSPLKEEMFVALVNNGIDSLWSDVHIKLNDTSINKSSRHHGYRAYIPKLLSYPKAAKKEWMRPEMWMEDEIYKFDPLEADSSNHAFVKRMNVFKRRGIFEEEAQRPWTNKFQSMFGRVFTDLNTCDAGILPGVSLNMELVMESDNFRLMAPQVYPDAARVEIKSATLHIPLATLNPKLWHAIENRLKHEPSSCFYTRCEVSTHTITPGSNEFEVEMYNSNVAGPARMVITFVTNKQFHGDILTNPWLLKRVFEKTIPGRTRTVDKTTTWIETLTLTINGKEIDSIKCKGDQFDDLPAYLRLNLYQGVQNTQMTNGITYEDFLDHAALYVFDLTTSNKHSAIQDFWSPVVKSGNIRMEVKFGGDPLPYEIKMVCFNEFPSLYKVDKDNQINFSYFTSRKEKK